MSHQIKNIAIVGASGNLGTQLITHLLQNPSLSLTAITRATSTSTSTLPATVTIKQGDYASAAFLDSALEGQDVLIVALGFAAPPDLQTDFIEAAARVGVPWVLPCEFGSDGANEALVEAVPLLGHKGGYRRRIEELGRSSWIAVATNPWFDYSLAAGHFGIDVAARTATLYSGGHNRFNTTTLPQVGRAVAALLSLPAAQLERYRNAWVYVTSFAVSQAEILAAVQKVTGTGEGEWTVQERDVDEFIAEGGERLRKGDFLGMVGLLYGNTFKEGSGDRFQGKEVANEVLGLGEENLEEAVKGVVAGLGK